ncbi:MAG: type II toxin-antitoxin system RelE/ParE family toxin [Tatlockia sp.]|jgi:hypothetical protein
MSWDVEYTNEFELWWNDLTEKEQVDVAATVNLLESCGPNLKFPFSSGIEGSKLSHLRELRIQHAGQPYRVLYAFDPRRSAILLLGGNKTGDDRWYEKNIPVAERLYQEHLLILKAENDNG